MKRSLIIKETGGGQSQFIPVPAGTHTLRVANDYSVPRTLEFTVQAGESLDLGAIELRPLPVTLVVNPSMPRDCTFEVRRTGGKTVYGLVGNVASFEMHEPDPTDEVVFTCPGRDELRYPIGVTEPGQPKVIPTAMPSP